jgi:hypothetical protein
VLSFEGRGTWWRIFLIVAGSCTYFASLLLFEATFVFITPHLIFDHHHIPPGDFSREPLSAHLETHTLAPSKRRFHRVPTMWLFATPPAQATPSA